jgi:hypothetical protein
MQTATIRRQVSERLRIVFPLTLLALALPSNAQQAAQFDLRWQTLDGGSGSTRSGRYQIDHTIHQVEAGPAMSGSIYTLQGGFWAGFDPNTDLIFKDGLQ